MADDRSGATGMVCSLIARPFIGTHNRLGIDFHRNSDLSQEQHTHEVIGYVFG
jgi:hypothetical protein